MTEATEPGRRIVTLDVIRGIAVMGIFSVNVVAFAFIFPAYMNPSAAGGHHGIDLATWFANFVLIKYSPSPSPTSAPRMRASFPG